LFLKPVFDGGANQAGGRDAGSPGLGEERAVHSFGQWKV